MVKLFFSSYLWGCDVSLSRERPACVCDTCVSEVLKVRVRLCLTDLTPPPGLSNIS